MTGGLAALALAAGSLTTGLLVLAGWQLTAFARREGDPRAAAVGVLVSLLGGVFDSTVGGPLVLAAGGFALGLLVGRGALEARGFASGALLVIGGLVLAFLHPAAAPVHGAGLEATIELWLRAPITPIAVAVGASVALAARRPSLAAVGVLWAVGALWLEGRPRIVEAGTIAALLGGAACAGRTGSSARLIWLVVGVQLLAAATGIVPAVDPYGHPPDIPRRQGAVLDVRVGGAALVSGLAAAPDGRVYYGEMASGLIWELDPSGPGPGAQLTRIPLPEVRGDRASYELGLWGLAVDPGGEWLYAMAAHRWDPDSADPSTRTSRVVRVGLHGRRRGVLEDVLLDLPAGPVHSGGVLAFGPDGALYVTVGDGLRYGVRGEIDSVEPGPGILAGALLRVTPTGQPFGADPDPASTVFAWGFRNPYGLAVDGDRLWVTENGGDCCDRLFAVAAGGDHGWPPGRSAESVEPVWDSGPHRLGITGVAVLGSPYGVHEGDLLFSTWHTGALHRVRVGDGAVLEHEIVLAVPPDHPDEASPYAFAGAFTALARDPDGVVWFSTLNAVGRVVSLDR